MTLLPLLDPSATAVRAADAGRLATPYLRLDVPRAVRRFQMITAAFGPGTVHYAVKANPHPELLGTLVRAGGRFDVASAGEVELASPRPPPSDLIFSNPVKRRSDIAYAYVAGPAVRRRLRRRGRQAGRDRARLVGPGPPVHQRRRLGPPDVRQVRPASSRSCSVAAPAHRRGLDAAGVAFHVGSQQRDPRRWVLPIAQRRPGFARLRAAGLRPRCSTSAVVFRPGTRCLPEPSPLPPRRPWRVRRHFGTTPPDLILEPGRGVVGDAGQLVAEVLGVTSRPGRRWVTLDVGIFSGWSKPSARRSATGSAPTGTATRVPPCWSGRPATAST